MDKTPASERLHIAFVGRRNVGKSSLVNAIAGQAVSIVSDVPGTTTDPVRKAIELPSLGACILIDTAGLDDVGALGALRTDASRRLIPTADIAVVVCVPASEYSLEEEVIAELKAAGTPFVVVMNKCDKASEYSGPELAGAVSGLAASVGAEPVKVSAVDGTGIKTLLAALLMKVPEDFDRRTLLAGLVKEGDVVVLVMPQDKEAPKGRLIMPEVMALRELLDRKCVAVSCAAEKLKATLEGLKENPDLVIVDSSVFKSVAPLIPDGVRLTSFSILMAAYKGDIGYFVESASAIDRLSSESKVLIAESCSHVPIAEDIGRVKIPAMLRKKYGDLDVEVVSGSDFPEDLSPYSLVIHCGGCVFSRRHLMSRVEEARRQGVPMTNYGIALAHITGILPKVVIPR